MHTLKLFSVHGKNLRSKISMIIGTLVFLLFFTSLPSFAATIIYEYDALNRLQTVNYGNGFLETYSYDGTGNRTSLAIADVVSPTGNITTSQITLTNGNATISGTASDLGSGVQKVEISFDDGQTWHTATGTTNWSYTWATIPAGTYPISVRVTDKGGNVYISPSYSITITLSAPLYATFTGDGLYQWNGTAWTQLTNSHPASMAVSDTSLYVDFAGDGLYQWNGTAWTQLTNSHPASMAVSDTGLYVDFAGDGLYQWNGTAWTQLTNSHPASMAVSDTSLYVDFPAYGLYQWNGTAWTQLTNSRPASMVVSDTGLYVDFAGDGLYQWNGTTWTQLTNSHPHNMVVTGSTLYVSFTGDGLYKYVGTTWTLLDTRIPESMVVDSGM